MGATRAGRLGPLTLVAAVLLGACGNSETPTTPSPRPRPKASPSPSAPPSRPAPLVVQIENSPAARPQAGLSAANTIYEYVSEGGIGRLSAVFAGPPPARLGPVRSARLATLELLRFYQGVLVYSGASIYISGLLQQSPQKHYDEDHAFGDLFRIGGRVAPHNLYTDGSRLSDLLKRAAAAPVSYQPAFIGAERPALPPPAAVPASATPSPAPGASSPATASPSPPPTVPAAPVGRPVSSLTVPISYREQPSFTWDPASAAWTRQETTGTFIDDNTGEPVTPRTVIVQQVDVRTAPEVRDVVGEYGVRHTLVGAGTAQVFSGGLEFDATWTQPAIGPAQFSLSNGAPAPVAPGLIWVCLVPIGSPAVAH